MSIVIDGEQDQVKELHQAQVTALELKPWVLQFWTNKTTSAIAVLIVQSD